MISLSTLYFTTVDWSDTTQAKGTMFSVEQAFVGRDGKRTPLKTPTWEASFRADGIKEMSRGFSRDKQ